MLFPISLETNLEELTKHLTLYGVEERDLAVSYNDAELRILASQFQKFSDKQKFNLIQKMSLIVHEKTFEEFCRLLSEKELKEILWSC